LAKFSAVTDAFRAFPTPIFSLWLRFRRNSADLWHPHWRTTVIKKRKVELLDDAAALGSSLN
jgi:hypothetical protein